MGQLEKLLTNSQRSTSPFLKAITSKSLAEKLGVESAMSLEEFRSLLAQKCLLKRIEALPVLTVSRCDGIKVDFETESTNGNISDDDSNHLGFDPLDLPSFNVYQRQNESNNEIKIDIENVIKLEPIPQDPIADLISESDDREPVDDEPSPSNLSPKSKEVKKKGKVKCPKCDKLLRNSFIFSKHNRYHHEPVKCNDCDKILNGRKTLFTHVLRHHHKVGSYPCTVCSKVFTTLNKMVIHKRKYHDYAKNKNCPFCSRSFFSNSTLETHITVAHKPEEHFCLLCPGKVFAIKDYLVQHLRKVHGKDANGERIKAGQKRKLSRREDSKVV